MQTLHRVLCGRHQRLKKYYTIPGINERWVRLVENARATLFCHQKWINHWLQWKIHYSHKNLCSAFSTKCFLSICQWKQIHVLLCCQHSRQTHTRTADTEDDDNVDEKGIHTLQRARRQRWDLMLMRRVVYTHTQFLSTKPPMRWIYLSHAEKKTPHRWNDTKDTTLT